MTNENQFQHILCVPSVKGSPPLTFLFGRYQCSLHLEGRCKPNVAWLIMSVSRKGWLDDVHKKSQFSCLCKLYFSGALSNMTTKVYLHFHFNKLLTIEFYKTSIHRAKQHTVSKYKNLHWVQLHSMIKKKCFSIIFLRILLTDAKQIVCTTCCWEVSGWNIFKHLLLK